MSRYKVIKDTREQQGWVFSITKNCEGTVVKTLPTGDYSLEGYEHLLTIERKGMCGEFARNIYDKRFERELERMREFKYSFIILEFNLSEIINFPEGSGIPRSEWPKLKISPWFMLKRLIEFQVKYNTKIILAGNYGKEVAASIFKRVVEEHEQDPEAFGLSQKNQ